MPEDTIDGSNLEENAVEPQSEAIEPVVTESGQPEPQATVEPTPQTNIPEQYRGLSPEQLLHELQKKDSMLGRYKAEVSNYRQQVRQTPQVNPQYSQPLPSSLPGQEALGQRQEGQILDFPRDKWNELYYEKPAEVIERIVEGKVMQGIQSFQQQELQRQQNVSRERAHWISSIDDDELSNIRLEENYTPDHEALMESLAKRDQEIVNKLRDPNLKEQDVRDAVRNLYAKADKILKGDPERLKAFTAQQKIAAANGAPAPKASTTGVVSGEQLPQSASNYKFLFGD